MPELINKQVSDDCCFDFVAIDFETANNLLSSACSIGLVAVKNNEIVDTYHSLIKPNPLEFHKKNTEIHGITPEKVKDAPSFPQVWEKIKKYFNGNTIVAHNASFDMSVLKKCLIENNLEVPDFDYLCSIPISTRACRGENIGASLKDRLTYFDIPLENHHDALCDALACAKLVLMCIKRQKRKTFENYCRIYNSLPVKQFRDVKVKDEFLKGSKDFSKYRVNITEIESCQESFNQSHAFYGKNMVFTGELQSLDRKTAMQKVVDLGAVLKSGVTKQTHYLIVGKQDISLVGDDGLSSKEEKAYDLISKGHDLKILTEKEFLELL